MAGSFAEQSTLASDNTFINKCKVAMLFRANQVLTSVELTDKTFGKMQQAKNIISSAGGDAPNMAWKVATTNPTIAGQAPAVPIDGDVQFAVNAQLLLDIS